MKYVNGIVLGLIIGLTVGSNVIRNPFDVDSLPHLTVYIIIAFGFVGGVLTGIFLLHKNPNPSNFLAKYIDRFIDYYSLLTVCMLSMGIPILLKVGFSDFYASRLLSGYFFSCVGIGLVFAGTGKFLWTYRTRFKGSTIGISR